MGHSNRWTIIKETILLLHFFSIQSISPFPAVLVHWPALPSCPQQWKLHRWHTGKLLLKICIMWCFCWIVNLIFFFHISGDYVHCRHTGKHLETLTNVTNLSLIYDVEKVELKLAKFIGGCPCQSRVHGDLHVTETRLFVTMIVHCDHFDSLSGAGCAGQ